MKMNCYCSDLKIASLVAYIRIRTTKRETKKKKKKESESLQGVREWSLCKVISVKPGF